MRTHIFGAASGIGRWFSTVGSHGLGEIFAYDTDRKVLTEYAHIPSVTPVHLDRDNAISGDYVAPVFGHVNEGDWIFLAVPEAAIEGLCQIMKVHVPHGCLIALMTSRQREPLKTARGIFEKHFVCGVHPLFGPTVGSPFGQTVALTFEGHSSPQLKTLEATLRDSGLNVTRLRPEDHDSQMAYVQALTHFTLLTFSKVIADSGIAWQDLMLLKTPPFQFVSAFAARLLMGSPATYAAIQKSPESARVREAFSKAANLLISTMVDPEPNQLETMIEQMRAPLGGSELEALSQFSFMADSAVQTRERQFFELKRSSDLIVFRTSGLGGYRVGRIVDSEPTTVSIIELETKAHQREGANLIPVPFDDTAVKAYQKVGINVRFSKAISVRKGRLQMLGRAQALEWLNKAAIFISASISVPNPRNLSEDVFEKWIPMLLPEIQKCEFKESFKKKGELAKVELRLLYHPSADLVKIRQKIRAFCYNSFDDA